MVVGDTACGGGGWCIWGACCIGGMFHGGGVAQRGILHSVVVDRVVVWGWWMDGVVVHRGNVAEGGGWCIEGDAAQGVYVQGMVHREDVAWRGMLHGGYFTPVTMGKFCY